MSKQRTKNPYQVRRTNLLYRASNHLCLHCGHPGSAGNPLEFHYCGSLSKEYRPDDGVELPAIDQGLWEYEHWHDKEYAIIVLCKNCHVRAHSEERKNEEMADKFIIAELTRYRFCVNKCHYCSYKSCIDCDNFRKGK